MRQFTKISEGRTSLTRDEIGSAMDRMEWKPIGCGHTEPFMQAQGIKEAIRQLRLKATHYANSSELAPLGLLAVRSISNEGAQKIYFIDEGDGLVPLAIDNEEN